jgi:aryl-alcohol dehydrogenase-like predicted oxidoreductase
MLVIASIGSIVCISGRGCMTMTAFYGQFDRAAAESGSLATIGRALDLGINMFDTAWVYQVRFQRAAVFLNNFIII